MDARRNRCRSNHRHYPTPEGKALTITWDQVSVEPGWCKLDWVIADPQGAANKQLALEQCDQPIVDVVDSLEGEKETEIVRQLLRLRRALEQQQAGEELSTSVLAARAEVINIVNNFFYEKLAALPEIALIWTN